MYYVSIRRGPHRYMVHGPWTMDLKEDRKKQSNEEKEETDVQA